jgi:plasmid rolling circle replication initiator protein Rep
MSQKNSNTRQLERKYIYTPKLQGVERKNRTTLSSDALTLSNYLPKKSQNDDKKSVLTADPVLSKEPKSRHKLNKNEKNSVEKSYFTHGEIPFESAAYLLSDYSEKDKIWDKHKGDAVKLADFLSGVEELAKPVQRLRNTANNLTFKWVDNLETGESKLKLESAWFSRWRHDPVSNWRKTMKWRSLWFHALPKIFEAHETHRWVLATLTVENCKIEELNKTCKHLNKSFRKLVRGAKFAQYLDPRRESSKDSEGNPIAGYYKALEVTKEKERKGYAHPHIHVLFHLPASYFDEDNYVTQQKLSELWQKAAGLDYAPVVDIRAVKPKKDMDDNFGGLLDAVMEVTKYPNKAADLLVDIDWTVEYIRQMDRVRLTDVGGTLKAFIKEERLDGDLVHIDEDGIEDENKQEVTKEILHFVFNHSKTVRRYVRKESKSGDCQPIFDG